MEPSVSNKSFVSIVDEDVVCLFVLAKGSRLRNRFVVCVPTAIVARKFPNHESICRWFLGTFLVSLCSEFVHFLFAYDGNRSQSSTSLDTLILSYRLDQ